MIRFICIIAICCTWNSSVRSQVLKKDTQGEQYFKNFIRDFEKIVDFPLNIDFLKKDIYLDSLREISSHDADAILLQNDLKKSEQLRTKYYYGNKVWENLHCVSVSYYSKFDQDFPRLYLAMFTRTGKLNGTIELGYHGYTRQGYEPYTTSIIARDNRFKMHVLVWESNGSREAEQTTYLYELGWDCTISELYKRE